MSKLDKLKEQQKKSGLSWAPPEPRDIVQVEPLGQASSTPSPKPAPKVQKSDVVPIFAKIPREEKRWVDHYRVDSGKELGDIVSEAIALLKKQVEKGN